MGFRYHFNKFMRYSAPFILVCWLAANVIVGMFGDPGISDNLFEVTLAAWFAWYTAALVKETL